MKSACRLLLVVFSLGVAQAYAGPVSYDGSTSTTDNSFYATAPILLGTALTFDAWWEVSNPSSSSWPTLNLNVNVGGLPFITNFSRNSSTGGWIGYAPNLPGSLLGQTQSIRFDVDDFGLQTGTTVWIRNVASNAQPVPEPGTIGLLGAGLVALALMRLRRRAS